MQSIKNTTLLLSSEEAILAPLEKSKLLVKNIKNAELVALLGGHASSVESPTQFIDQITKFLL